MNTLDEQHYPGSNLPSSKMPGNSGPLKAFILILFISQIIGILLVVCTAAWLSQLNMNRSGFGFTDNLVFNYHPMLMIFGMIFVYGEGILAYRVLRNYSKWNVKLLHATLNLLAFVCTCLGLRAVFYAHRNARANLYSLHSWLGIACAVFFAVQWLLGFAVFLMPHFSQRARAIFLPHHKRIGVFILCLATAALLTGITEVAVHSNKYELRRPREVLLNAIGLLAIGFVSLIVFLVTQDDYKRIDTAASSVYSQNHHHHSHKLSSSTSTAPSSATSSSTAALIASSSLGPSKFPTKNRYSQFR